MKVSSELSLVNFNFWSGAESHKFTYSELKELEFILEDLYPYGIEETKVNDIFWFEEEFLCESIGIDFEDDYLERE